MCGAARCARVLINSQPTLRSGLDHHCLHTWHAATCRCAHTSQQMPWSPTDSCCSVSFASSLRCVSSLSLFTAVFLNSDCVGPAKGSTGQDLLRLVPQGHFARHNCRRCLSSAASSALIHLVHSGVHQSQCERFSRYHQACRSFTA